MGSLNPEEKKKLGQTLTEAKDKVTEAYEAKQRSLNMAQINQKLNEDVVDGSLDIVGLEQGSFSLLANIRREVEEIFTSL